MSETAESRRLKILVIYDLDTPRAATRKALVNHLHALDNCPAGHDITYFNARDHAPRWIEEYGDPPPPPASLLEERFDAVILHFTFLSCRMLGLPFFQWKRNFEWIADLAGVTVAIPLDEGDFVHVLDEWLFEMGVEIIFSVHHKPQRPLYPIMRNRADIYACFPGYVNEQVRQDIQGRLLPISQRMNDIVYRARHLSFRFGKAGQMKHRVGEVIASHARRQGLRIDISTDINDTILGDAWMDFLASGRTVLGTEGGYSALDYRGELRAQVNHWLLRDPDIGFEELDRKMPAGWDDFDLLTVTPRHFEAVAARSCQILVEGEYRGILEPDVHYICVKRDFSNVDEVLQKLRDHDLLQSIADRAYQDICESGRYTYAAFGSNIERAIIKRLSTASTEDPQVMSEDAKQQALQDIVERDLIAARHFNAFLLASVPVTPQQIAHALLVGLKAGISYRLKKYWYWVTLGAIAVPALFALFIVLIARWIN